MKAWIIVGSLVTLTSIAACSNTGSDDPAGTGPSSSSTDPQQTATNADTSTQTDNSEDTDAEPHGTGQDSESESFEECAGVTEEATLSVLPADIVLVVDNSGSMTDEAEEVRTNLNGFSEQIVSAGVDARVILVSAFRDEYNNGICVEPPLGSGTCPDDSNLPDYFHVDRYITSHYGPKWVLDAYDDWKDRLRPGAMTHFVFVSDDNPYTEAAEFIARLAELKPPITEYMVHAIASRLDNEIACDISTQEPCCQYAVNEGVVYKDLVNETGGVFGDLCSQQFQGVFDQLATKVKQNALSCDWPMPAPPVGETLDPGKVNVSFHDAADDEHDIGWVASAADCSTVTAGWYYDDPANPMSMHLCPQTCDWVRAESTGRIEISLGCETKDATPV